MRKFIIYILYGLLVMLVLTFLNALGDDLFLRKYYQGVWHKDIIGSVKYYVLWVLPYWWFLVLIGSIVLAAVFYGIQTVIGKLIK